MKVFVVLLFVSLALTVSCIEDTEAQCPDPDESVCDFAEVVEHALAARDVDFFLDRLAVSTYRCPIDNPDVYPCQDEPEGSEVRRVSHELIVEDSQAGGWIAPELLGRILTDFVEAVRSEEQDALGSGSFRVHAVGRYVSGQQAALALSAIVTLPPLMASERLGLIFEITPVAGDWLIERVVMIIGGPDPAAVWMLTDSERRWLKW